MSRAKWKVTFFNIGLNLEKNTSKALRINNYFDDSGYGRVSLHSGTNTGSMELKINKYMVGYKMGEFILSKKVIKHSKSLKHNRKRVQIQATAAAAANKKLNKFYSSYKFIKNIK